MDNLLRPRRVAIFVEDHFPLIPYALVLRAFAASNEAAGYRKFTWRTVSSDGGRIRSDVGAFIETDYPRTVGQTQGFAISDDILMVLSNIKDSTRRKAVLPWMRECLSRGAEVLSVGAGTEMLCEAGILDGKRCAVHWSDFGAAAEKFPRVLISRSFFETDGAVTTSAGELATLDAILRVISSQLPANALEAVSARILHGPPRNPSDRQSLPEQIRLRRLNSPLLRVLDLMEDNIVDPLPLEHILRSANVSRRQAERLFGKQLGISPKRFYLRLRLERAQELLQHTNLQVAEVAAATGFISHSHFSKTFKTVMGSLPVAVRRRISPNTTATNSGASGCSQPPATNDNVGRPELLNVSDLRDDPSITPRLVPF